MLTKCRERSRCCRQVILVLLAVLVTGGQSAPATEKVDTPEKRIAHIRLSGQVRQSPPDMSLFGDGRHMTLADWLKRLAKARNDDSIAAVALEIGSPGLKWSQGQELADAISRLNSVKPVYVYLQSAGFAQYLIASKATEIAMEPSGELWIIGLGAELMFFKAALDKLRLTPQMVQIGRFKGAAEPFTNTGPSKETIDSYERILDDLFRQMCQAIASSRKLKTEAVKAAIDEGPIGATGAVKARLVDRLVEKIDWPEHVRAQVSPAGGAKWISDYAFKSGASVDLSNPFALLKLIMGAASPPVRDPSIAIIHAEGVITAGQSGEGLMGQQTAGARTLIKCFKEATENDKIKGVVFRVDSPGGSAAASELIYQAVRKCADRKPVVVSVSSMAASGGYYIAAGGGEILADESAIIGSIGVISGKIATNRTLEWIGITRHEITRGANAGLRMSRPWNKRELERIRGHAQRWYDKFTSRVKQSRKDKIKDMDKVAQGRIFTAPQAVTNGLIDRIGGLNDAVELVKKSVGLKGKKCSYVTMPRPKTLADLLSPQGDVSHRPPRRLEDHILTAIIGRSQGAAYLLNLAQLMSTESVVAAMPCFFEVRP